MKFALIYIFRCGFLDGRAGFAYANLQAIYEYMIVIKTRELENDEGGKNKSERADYGHRANPDSAGSL